MIADDPTMIELGGVTKMLPSPVILGRLKDAGRGAAERFLSQHQQDLGQRSTVDLDHMFA